MKESLKQSEPSFVPVDNLLERLLSDHCGREIFARCVLLIAWLNLEKKDAQPKNDLIFEQLHAGIGPVFVRIVLVLSNNDPLFHNLARRMSVRTLVGKKNLDRNLAVDERTAIAAVLEWKMPKHSSNSVAARNTLFVLAMAAMQRDGFTVTEGTKKQFESSTARASACRFLVDLLYDNFSYAIEYGSCDKFWTDREEWLVKVGFPKSSVTKFFQACDPSNEGNRCPSEKDC